MRFQLPFVPRSRHDADVAALNAALKDASEKYADTSSVNDCLTEELKAARARLAEYHGVRTAAEVLEEQDVYRKATAEALGAGRHLNWDQLINTARTLRAAVGAHEAAAEGAGLLEGVAAAVADPRREDVEAWDARVKAHDEWVPGDPEARPVDGASGRPTHPAVELRRALDRCSALQKLLDGRGKRAAS